MMKPQLRFFEGILSGFIILELWLIWHYGWGFELQGIGHGFRPVTLFNLCLFSFIIYRFLTNFDWVESIIYTITQYVFYDTVFAIAIIPNPEQLLTYPMMMHYVMIFICTIILVLYYTPKFKPEPSFKIKYLFSLLLAISIPIFITTKLGWSVPNNNAFIMARDGDPNAFISYNKDQFFKWLMFIPFTLSSKKMVKHE